MNRQYRRQYEDTFNKRLGSVGARVFGLGRQALVILLKSMGVTEGDKIGICGFTCDSVAEAVKVSGAKPVYLDVDEYFCIEPRQILAHKFGSLKAVIIQHTLGVPGKFDELLEACKQIGAEVIEDCAHSLGCYWKGKHLGTFGAGAIFSTEWGKPYSTGQGGILTVNSQSLLEQVDQQIQEWALPASTISELLLSIERKVYPYWGPSRFRNYFRHMCNRFHYQRPTGLDHGYCLHKGYVRLGGKGTTKVGLKQLEKWSGLMRLRRENTRMIEDRLHELGLALWPRPAEADVTLLIYPVRTAHRAAILKEARKERLPLMGYYGSPVNPFYGDDLAKVDYELGCCPRSEEMLGQLVYLPTSSLLTESNLKAMLRIISNSS